MSAVSADDARNCARTDVAGNPVAHAILRLQACAGLRPLAQHVVAESQRGDAIALHLDHELSGEAVAAEQIALRRPFHAAIQQADPRLHVAQIPAQRGAGRRRRVENDQAHPGSAESRTCPCWVSGLCWSLGRYEPLSGTGSSSSSGEIRSP